MKQKCNVKMYIVYVYFYIMFIFTLYLSRVKKIYIIMCIYTLHY
jgi:hypothetical protein